MAFWRELPGKITKQQNGFGGGVNEGLPPLQIAENQASAMLNLVPSEGGAATVRGGRSVLGTTLGAGIDYLGAHGTSHLLAAANGSMYKWDGSAWVSIGTVTSGLAGDSCEFMGYTWFVNGTDGDKWDGTTFSAITGLPAGTKFIKEDDNRLWALADKKLSYSALRKGEDWTTALDSGAIDLENPYGEVTTSLQVFGGRVMIFTDHTFEEVYGTNPDNYQQIRGSLQIGCVAHRSFQEIRGRTYWLCHDGVYRYVGGVAPQKISTAVQGEIDSLNWSARSKANAWVDGDWYVLAIPTGTNTEADTILVYDTIHDTWWVGDMGGAYPRQAVSFGGTLYVGAHTSYVYSLTGTTDAGTAISWSWTTGAKQENGFSRQDIYRAFQVVELPTGSTLSLAVSPSVTGDSDWVTIGSMTAGTGYQKKAFYFSPGAAANLNWMRLKVSGTGPATLHELVREMRIKERV